MRLALVISSSYSESSAVTAREAFSDTAQLVHARLVHPDLDFQVVQLAANRDLPENLEALLEKYETQFDELLIFFSGYVAVKAERGPALLLDGSRLRAFPMSRLRSAIAQSALRALLVMDVVAVTDAPVLPAAVAAEISKALNELTPHVSVLTSAALISDSTFARRGCSRLSDLWLLALNYEAGRAIDSHLFASQVVHSLQGERLAFADLPSFDYQPGEHDFVLLPGPKVGGLSNAAIAQNASTERSSEVSPPGFDTDPLPGDDTSSVERTDTLIDELKGGQRAAQATIDSEVDDAAPTPAPSAPDDLVTAAVRFPSLPPLPKPPPQRPQPAAQSDWLDRASFLPSSPPPPVQPKTGGSLSGNPFAPSLSQAPNGPPVIARSPEGESANPRQRVEDLIRQAMQLDGDTDYKSQVLTEAAAITLRELHDPETALDLAHEALRISPLNSAAFEVELSAHLASEQLEPILEKGFAILSQSLDPALRGAASRYLVLAIERQGHARNVDESQLELLIDSVRDEPELNEGLERVLSPAWYSEEDLLQMQETLQRDPRDVHALQVLSDVAERENALDTAALASSVIVCLNSQRAEDTDRAAQIASEGLPPVTRILSNEDLEENLLGVADVAPLRALSRLVPAGVAAGLCGAAPKGGLPKEATVLDPAVSTTTLARSLAWSAHFVNVTTPLIALVTDLPRPMELVLSDEPQLLVSRQLGSGLSLAQLAFLGARQLAYLRSEFLWRLAFETPEQVSQMLGMCARFAQEGTDFPRSLDESQRRAAKRLAAYLEDDESLSQLVNLCFGNMDPDPSACQILGEDWVFAIDRAALRIGLLACAYPPVAFNLVGQFAHPCDMTLEEQLDEVASFAISRGHQVLRKSLGLTSSGS